ncbi:MAG: hypothetical protein Q3962_02435 [Corynebacterium sp.]|nr:hypothetical protein [Corynebacterium sp.]
MSSQIHIKIIDEHTGDQLLTATECATKLGISRSAWRRTTRAGRAPKPVTRLGRHLYLWRAADVDRA